MFYVCGGLFAVLFGYGLCLMFTSLGLGIVLVVMLITVLLVLFGVGLLFGAAW